MYSCINTFQWLFKQAKIKYFSNLVCTYLCINVRVSGATFGKERSLRNAERVWHLDVCLGRHAQWCQAAVTPWVTRRLVYARKHGQREGRWMIDINDLVCRRGLGSEVLTINSLLQPFIWYLFCRFFSPPWFFFQSRRSGRHLLFEKYFCFVPVTCYFILDFFNSTFFPEFHVFSWRYLCLAAGS